MSAKVTDVIGVQKKKTAVTAEEEKQDREDDAHDKELMDLLKTSRLIEELTTAELSGKSRRKHLSWKLLELGAEARTCGFCSYAC
ncbi:hypothetical protein DFJ73DRAFT_809653 [Zopfochytrium polystomum]|nr:hypothetical protein DFJ73DRAFT_809653 [Zopfochytrium polystomum]